MIRYGQQDIDEDDVLAVVSALRSDWITTGPAVERFESDLEEWTGGVPVVSVSSGTAALHAAYSGLGIGPGDEVITTPISFVATAATAALLGATVVFADVDPDTANIDPVCVERLISARTKAITAVDYAGHPADLDRLRELADNHGVFLIEDAAHSLGSTYGGRAVGSIADVTTFSFYPTKNITTAEGGAVAALDAGVLDRIRLFCRQGLIRDPVRQLHRDEGAWHQEVHEFGLNYRLPDVLAALGSAQLDRLAVFKECRAKVKSCYDQLLADAPECITPLARPNVDPMWHLYPVRVPARKRRSVFDHLRNNGVWVQVNYMPVYWHPVFSSSQYPRGLCPKSEDFYQEEISLPMYSTLTEDEIGFVVETLAAGLSAAK
jgi:dTDP-4-amino-4,6-dideoxygalactose transaminase